MPRSRPTSSSPQLTALGAISQADGITEVLESTAALQNAESALQGRYDAYDAADTLAQAADDRAADALADARTAAQRRQGLPRRRPRRRGRGGRARPPPTRPSGTA